MRKFALVLITGMLLYLMAPNAFAQNAAQVTDFSNTLWGKIAIAGISAFLSLLVGYILYFIKDRKEERKRLSYDVEFKKGMLGIEERLSKDLSVTYKGRSAENITYVRCEILNSGTSIIRKQRLRFEFSSGSEVLDWSVDPKPPKELGFAPANGTGDGLNERTFQIAHFQVEQRLSLHFIVAGNVAIEMRVYGFNEEEDVQVIQGNIGVVADDRRQIERFIFLYLLTLFVPRVLNGVPVFGEMAAGLYYAIAMLIALPLIPTVSRLVASLITSAIDRRGHSVSIVGSTVKGTTVVVGGGTSTMLRDDESELKLVERNSHSLE